MTHSQDDGSQHTFSKAAVREQQSPLGMLTAVKFQCCVSTWLIPCWSSAILLWHSAASSKRLDAGWRSLITMHHASRQYTYPS